VRAYLSIGSNIRPHRNIPRALRKIKKTFRACKISSIYETAPVGPVSGKKEFWNLALQIETRLSREKLRSTLKRLELELGRLPRSKFAPRPIDIDLILYGNWKRKGFERFAFVLFPLAEIAPRLKPPGKKRSLSGLVRGFSDPGQEIRKIKKAAL